MAAVAPEADGVVTEQPGANAGTRGSIESLGRWNEKRDDRAMPVKFTGHVSLAFIKFVDELVQQKSTSSGILAISQWKEGDPYYGTGWVRGFSWSASPDDVSYQRHGAPDEAARLKARLAAIETNLPDPVKMRAEGEKPLGFADFEGVVHDYGDLGEYDQNNIIMAVYRVTLPTRGFDPWKWVGRPPPPAPEELHTGTRSDGLLSTEDISGEYSAACICHDGCCPVICNSMSVVPLGADTIETWDSCCLLSFVGPPTGPIIMFPYIGPVAEGAVRTRNPGTNTFRHRDGTQSATNFTTFSADGTATVKCVNDSGSACTASCCGGYKRRPGSKKRTFQKVDTRDLAGKWCGVANLGILWPFSYILCTTKKALNEDQYEESGFCCCCLGFPESFSGTRTRRYVNGHPTNGFALDKRQYDIDWHRDPGCAGKGCFLAKKVG